MLKRFLTKRVLVAALVLAAAGAGIVIPDAAIEAVATGIMLWAES